jgi:type IV pilus assembly protein PilM
MAKGIGLDAGTFEVKVVELDGSYRKPRLAKVNIDMVPSAGRSLEGHEQQEAETALQALKDAEIGRDGVCLGFPCREAVLRRLNVPFVGDDQIRKVLKFEAEGEIHSHNVDDMVVDFHTLERREAETQVLVAAVPKKSLGSLLEALNGFGIDPERVDLDTMALFRVAEWAGCFGEDVAEAAAAAAEEEGERPSELPTVPKSGALASNGRRVRVVVDLGARSTRILAVDGGKLVDMRALRIGFESIVDEIADRSRVAPDEARHAVAQALRTGADVPLEPIGSAAAAVADEESPGEELLASEPAVEVAPRAEVIRFDDVDAARQQLFARMRRELMRFLTALPQISAVERAFVTGGGSTLPGIRELLAETFDSAIQPLDVLARLSHNLEPEEAEKVGPRIAVAVGLALATMGGPGGFDFRREDLAYRRRFDRVKFPLAIACMLAAFLPFIYGVRQYNKLGLLSKEYGELYEVADTAGAEGRRGASPLRATFWGYVGQSVNKGEGGSNQLVRLLGAEKFEELIEKLLESDTFARLPIVRSYLQDELKKQQEETGVYEDLQLPSGLYVMSFFANVVQKVEKNLAPFLITELELKLEQDERNRHLTFKVAMRGDDYRRRFVMLQDALRATFEEPNSPFKEFGRAAGEDIFRGSEQGAFFEVRLNLKGSFDAKVER